MNVDIEIFNIFKEKHGEKEAERIVELLDKKLSNNYDNKKVATKFDISEAKSEIIKWVFLFILGQTAVLIAIMKLL